MTKKDMQNEKIKNEDVKKSLSDKPKQEQNNSEKKSSSEKAKKETKGKKTSSQTKKNKTAEKIKALEKSCNELNDKYLRLSAEYDNYRKRTLKERMELIKSAGEDTLINFLPIMDNIDRAKKSVDDAKDIGAIKEGINLIYKHIFDFLTERGIKEIEAIGETFDTDLHEALTKIPSPSEDLKGKVVDVIEKGYKLKDKVLRFSKVVVGE